MSDIASTRARRLARVQAISGLIFLAFAAVHLLNQGLAIAGPTVYDEFQRAARRVYQWPPLELAGVLLPIAVHIAAGVMRMRDRRGRGAPQSLRMRLHRYSAYYLLVFIVGHVVATRGPALWRGTHPEFGGVAFSFQYLPYYFYPYYAGLVLAGLVHAAIGAPLALGVLGVRLPASLRGGPGFWVPLAAAGACLVLGVAGLGGLLYAVPDYQTHPYARAVLDILASVTP